MNNVDKLNVIDLIKFAFANQGLQTPAIGSRDFRSMPQAQRQQMLNARDDQQFAGYLGNEISNRMENQATNSYNDTNAPTSKGGLQNIPARPAAHPMSGAQPMMPNTVRVQQPAFGNMVNRKLQGQTVLPVNRY